MKKVILNAIMIGSVCLLLFVYAISTALIINNAQNTITGPMLESMNYNPENVGLDDSVVSIATTAISTAITSYLWISSVLIPVIVALIMAVLLVIANVALREGKSGQVGYRIIMGIELAIILYLVFKMTIGGVLRLSILTGIFAVYLFVIFVATIITTYTGKLVEKKENNPINE